jgi:uncharacterized protein YjbI with pentapeptide repeats
MTEALKSKISEYRKNKVDIAPIIKDVDLKGADLSYCVLSHIERVKEDLTGINLSHAIVGSEGKINKFLNCKLTSANFDSVIFTSTTWLRSCDLRNANLRKGDFSKCAYEHSDFRGTTFCDAILRVGTNEAVGAKFDLNFFQELVKGSPYDVVLRPKGE